MLAFAAPSPLRGDALAREIEAVGFQRVRVLLDGADVRITGQTAKGEDITEADRSAIGAVVAAHAGRLSASEQEDKDLFDRVALAAQRVNAARKAGWANLSAAQKDAAAQEMLVLCSAVGRLIYGHKT